LQKDYRKKDQEVKRRLKRDKREWTNGIAQEAENAEKLGYGTGGVPRRYAGVCHMEVM